MGRSTTLIRQQDHITPTAQAGLDRCPLTGLGNLRGFSGRRPGRTYAKGGGEGEMQRGDGERGGPVWGRRVLGGQGRQQSFQPFDRGPGCRKRRQRRCGCMHCFGLALKRTNPTNLPCFGFGSCCCLLRLACRFRNLMGPQFDICRTRVAGVEDQTT